MLPPNCWNPEASGSQTGPPSQDSGGSSGPDSGWSDNGHSEPPASLLYLGQSLWPWCLGDAKDYPPPQFVLECGQAQCPLWTSVSPRKWAGGLH